MIEKDLFPALRAESGDRWKRMESCEVCEWRSVETGFSARKTKKQPGTQGPLNKTARERTRAPLKVEATRRRGKREEQKRRRSTEKGDGGKKKHRDHHKSVHDEDEEGRGRKGKQEKSKAPQSETNLGEIREVALSLFVTGVELTEDQCRHRRTTMKNGSGDETATRSADQRKQFEGKSPQKVEAAKRGRQK